MELTIGENVGQYVADTTIMNVNIGDITYQQGFAICIKSVNQR